MAISTGSPFGKLVGKLGSVVGFGWKNKNAVRSYAIPANPNTAAQQAQRSLMSLIVAIGKVVLSTICQKFWDPFVTGMSGYNAFVKANLLALTGLTDYQHLVFSDGSLEGESMTSVSYNTSNGEIAFSYNTTIQANGLASDKVVAVVYDTVNKMTYVNDTSALREDDNVTAIIATGLTAANLRAYLFLYRVDGDGNVTMVSPTTYHTVSAS